MQTKYSITFYLSQFLDTLLNWSRFNSYTVDCRYSVLNNQQQIAPAVQKSHRLYIQRQEGPCAKVYKHDILIDC